MPDRKTKLIILILSILAFGALQAYAVTSGQRLWVKRYDYNGGFDIANDMAVDESSNIYVTGESEGDSITIKYNTSGNRKWVRRYIGYTNSANWSNAIAIDSNNNIYVAGQSGLGQNSDIEIIKYDSGGNQKWVRIYDYKGYDDATAIVIDKNNNIYVAGASKNALNDYSDYAIVKYDSLGNRKWVRRYNGPGNKDDWVNVMTIDRNNNIYVTGQSHGGATTKQDFATIKYDPSGNRKWVKRYSYTKQYYNTESPDALAIDSKGNVFVVGTTSTSDPDGEGPMQAVTIKYDSSGNRKWVRLDDYSGWGPYVMALDSNNNIYVAGGTWGGNDNDKTLFMIKYDSSGNKKWRKNYSRISYYDTVPKAIAIDNNNNIYVACEEYYDNQGITIFKFDPAGNRKWVKYYDSQPLVDDFNDSPSAIAIDKNNNLYITGTGYGDSTFKDIILIKHAP